MDTYKSKHFDKNFHRILQKGFPDWEGRMEYEKKQRDLSELAQKKLKMSPLGISSSKENLEKVFSPEEKDAIAYFQGTGVLPVSSKNRKTPQHLRYPRDFSFKNA